MSDDKRTFSGRWHSYYRFPSSSRDIEDLWGEHLLDAEQDGHIIKMESIPGSPSKVSLHLELDEAGRIAKGTWWEKTQEEGYYKGREYEGSIELNVVDNGSRMDGVWHGKGQNGDDNSDFWFLAREAVDPSTANENN